MKLRNREGQKLYHVISGSNVLLRGREQLWGYCFKILITYIKIKLSDVWNWENSWTSKIFPESMLSWAIRPPFVNDTWIERTWEWYLKEKKKKKTKSFLFFTLCRGWDEDTFEPPMYSLLCRYKLKNMNFESSVPFKLCDLHWKRTNSVLYTEKVSLTDQCFEFVFTLLHGIKRNFFHVKSDLIIRIFINKSVL